MELSSELLSQFAKITKDDTKVPEVGVQVDGTARLYNGKIYVQLDGSDQLTPVISSTAGMKDGDRVTVTIKDHTAKFDGYTPLIELKENPPPLGYYVPKDDNVMAQGYRLANEHARAPVVKAESDVKVFRDFVANTDDTWITFISDLIANAKFYFDLDEMGRILFAPKQDTASLQPVWTFDDSNSSILYPELTYEQDLYGIPNVVEVNYADDHDKYFARVVNDDENSIISTVNRGREILHRVNNPEFSGIPTQAMVDEYAQRLLRELSTVQSTVTYTHGYCPVRIGDCVRLNYERAGMTDIKARVIRQSIKCEQGCPVSETAVFTKKLWR